MSTQKLIAALVAGAALAGLAGTSLAQDTKAQWDKSRGGQAEALLFESNPYWYNRPGWRPGGTPSATQKQVPAIAKDTKVPYEKSRAGQADAELMTGPYHGQTKHSP